MKLNCDIIQVYNIGRYYFYYTKIKMCCSLCVFFTEWKAAKIYSLILSQNDVFVAIESWVGAVCVCCGRHIWQSYLPFYGYFFSFLLYAYSS